LLDDARLDDRGGALETLVARIDAMLDRRQGSTNFVILLRWAGVFGPDALARVVKTYGRRHAFLGRVVGAAGITRMDRAIRNDAGVVLLAARRLIRAMIPFSVAIEDCSTVTPSIDTSALGDLANRGSTTALMELDALIDSLVDEKGYALDGRLARTEERRSLGVTLEGVVALARQVLATETDAQVAYADPALARKMRGFDQALANSEDGVSQAANSLVEFIDRLLRRAFTDAEVLAWIDQNYPSRQGLINAVDGRRRPTKLGQALCFTYGGEAPLAEPALAELAAKTLITIRRRAEKLKHADLGTAAETEALAALRSLMRAYLAVAIRIAWAPLGNSSPERLRERLTSGQQGDRPGPETLGTQSTTELAMSRTTMRGSSSRPN